jgi:hypothetical protein
MKEALQKILPEAAFTLGCNIYNRFIRHVPRDLSHAPTLAAPSPYPFLIDTDNELAQLAEKYLPTKRLHHYMPFYWMHLRDIRKSVKVFCEIGVQSDRSIKMWEEFFPNAEIHGIDLDPKCKEFEGGRRKIHIGSQDDPKFLKEVLAGLSQPPDVIIDDGSHLWYHQIASFNLLYPYLSEHGVYVIEDTGGCVGDFSLKTVNAIKPMIDSVMYWPEEMRSTHWGRLAAFPDTASWEARHTIGLAFYRWLVFVFRGRNPEDNPYLGKDFEY